MSLQRNSDDERLLAPFEERRGQKRIRVYDRRSIDREDIIVETSGLDFNAFLQLITKRLSIPSTERYCLTTTDRTVLDFDKFQELQDGNTLLIMQTEHQVLPAATKEQIVFTPHYHTLVRSGMYEYYASEGQMALPYALAELIDNSLSATASNKGERSIELRLLFDDTLGKAAVVFVDNGRGMTSKQLNNWAVYRLSKHTREDGKFKSDHQGYMRPEAVPRSINSDISWFGVGGKQAIFYIGDSTRMITRPTCSPDVHELIVSKEDFERKEMNNEDIYSGVIHNRKVGDSSHVQKESELFLHNLIAEETEKESFTAVVITGIPPEHVTFLKNDFDIWTRKLAHIYHYYIHGHNGNCHNGNDPVNQSNINIEISLREKSPRCPRVVNLREVDNDMQTLYINSTADTFEFKANTASGGTVEGLLRYHPFLYDRETYPQDPQTHPAPTEDEVEDGESGAGNQANGRRNIFECFWNGRLIPYTTLSEFEWCKWPVKHSTVPLECYRRFSGVLFANDRFLVSTNKLTFMDLELQLHKKDTIFTRIVNGQEQRVQIKREFSQWLTGCHERLDKQVHFVGFKKTITLADMQPKKMQYPWATFSSIEWDNKTYKTGQLVKSHRTHPILYGYIVQFLLYGDHDRDIYATRGSVEISLEPREIYDEHKTFLISKIDRTATNASIQKFIDIEMTKMPDKLQLEWPQGDAWPENAVMPAGARLGSLKVSILNKRGEEISRMPPSNQGARKLGMERRLVWHGPSGPQEIQTHTAQHSPKWAFWFKAMETPTKLGKYTLELNTMLNDTKMFGGKTLPSNKHNFTVTEGKAKRFVVEKFAPTLRVGVAYDMVLTLMDAFDHPAPPPPDLAPELSCCNLIVSYEKTSSSGTEFTIHGVKVRGSVPNYHCKARDLNVVLPNLESSSQTIKISLLPGEPHSLDVTSEKEIFTVENGNPMTFNIKVLDEAGNITAQPKLVVYCRVPQHTPISVDCSTTGAGQLITKPITARNLNEQQRVVKAKFDLPSQKHVSAVWKELTVVPSTRVGRLEVYFQDAGEVESVLRDEEKVEWKAGDVLENLHYRLYDEGQRLLSLDQHTARNMKVNWLAEVNFEDLARGKLPSIKVPTQVTNHPFYQISYKDQRASVDASFILVPCPDVPSQLKVTLEHSSMTMGEVLPGDIHLKLLDQHGNVTQKLTPQCVEAIKVMGEELDSTSLTVSWQESSKDVVVRGVRFRPGPPGPRELTFTLRTFIDQVKVMVTTGPPAQLQLLSEPQLPLQVFNEQGIPSPFLIQLCDLWGNPSPDQRVVVALTSSPSLEVKCPVMSQPVDHEGKASFTVERIAGPKGEFNLEFRGLFNQSPIPGPSVQLTVVLDPNKPASLVVDYDTNTSCPAGEALPVFSVSVLSEEGGPIRNVNPAALSMMLWRGETTSGVGPPSGTQRFNCSKPLENEEDDFHFHFRDKPGPEQTGKYSLQFSLALGRSVLQSKQYVLDVVANEPIKLAPDSQPTTIIVYNVEEPASRVLVQDLTLRIRDRFGNPAGQEVDGQVEVRVQLSPDERDKDLPTLEALSDLQLTKGTAHVSKLSINRNSPGSHGTKYVLVFQFRGPRMTLAPYLLLFHFYNDADNQRQMSELSRKKDQLSVKQKNFKEYYEDLEGLRRGLACKNQKASKKLTDVRTELFRRNVNMTPLKTDLEVRTALSEKIAQFDRIGREPKRTCTIADPYRGTHDVLGKVGHLALVEDNASANVISWHIQRDMDCLVTVTTAAARQIYDRTSGVQQVLPLDSVYVHPTDRPLPHSGTPPGNPVFARDLLIYTNDTDSCKKVFKNLLGDAILIDDLDAGNAYRKSVVQSNRYCPTILTRRGERINANGKFGGAQNRAPALSALRGQVFGAPFPVQYHILCKEIEGLQGYLGAIEASKRAEEELNAHVQNLQSPENMKMKQAMDENKRKLMEIESQLERTTSTSGRRALREVEQEEEGAGEAAGPPQKRPRT